MEIEQIFIANSAYSLYQYALQFSDKLDSTLFVCGPAIADDDLKHKMAYPAETTLKTFNFLLKEINTKLNGKIVPCYGNLVTPFAKELSFKYPFYALSDGLSDAQLFPQYLNQSNIQQCYATKLGAPWEKNTHHSKLTITDLKELWKHKTPSIQQKIAALFKITPQTFYILQQKKVILVTQPLSEDKIVTEEEKIALYKSLLSNYNPQDIVIKPHPREKTNWTDIFPNTPVITKQVPAELLSSLVAPEKVCTFFSTAAFQMTTPDKVDIYAKDFGQLKFSNPHKNMGTVPYVDIEKAYGNIPFNWKRIPATIFYRKSKENQHD